MKTALTPLTDAQRTVLETCSVLGREKVGVMESLGRASAEDLIAERANPPWNNSAMDGFAVRNADLPANQAVPEPVTLKVIEEVPAGRSATCSVGPGEAIRIMTGAPVPSGSDTVIKIEDTEPTETHVKIFSHVTLGSHIRLQGEDITKGECLIPRGTTIRPAEIGILAMMAKPLIFVHQRPRVAILSTGDELMDLDDQFDQDKITNSNGYAFAAQVREAGGIPILLGISKDRPEALKEKINEAANADILVISGGVSMGDYDFTKIVLNELGENVHAWKLAIKPGQPVTFGTIQRTLCFGLPGNPVSSMITFEQLVRPSILKMSGHSNLFRLTMQAAFQETFSKRPDRRHFLRGIVRIENGIPTVRTTGDQGSGILTSMLKANALIDIPESVEQLNPGDMVSVQILSGYVPHMSS